MPGGWEWLIIVVVLVALFGAKRLPELARSAGSSAAPPAEPRRDPARPDADR